MTVIVVGAGPAGAAAALLLARGGVEVLLVEREESFDRVFRGEGLMPLGIDALHQMGLGVALAEIPGRVIESWDIWIDGEETFVVPEPVGELGDRAPRVVSQPALLQRLVREAGRYRSFTFYPGCVLPSCCAMATAGSPARGWSARTGPGTLPRSWCWAVMVAARRCAPTRGSGSSADPTATTSCGSRPRPRNGSAAAARS